MSKTVVIDFPKSQKRLGSKTEAQGGPAKSISLFGRKRGSENVDGFLFGPEDHVPLPDSNSRNNRFSEFHRAHGLDGPICTDNTSSKFNFGDYGHE